MGVLWVEGHEFVKQDVGNGRHAHWRTGMAGVGIEGGIDLEKRSCQYLLGEKSLKAMKNWPVIFVRATEWGSSIESDVRQASEWC